MGTVFGVALQNQAVGSVNQAVGSVAALRRLQSSVLWRLCAVSILLNVALVLTATQPAAAQTASALSHQETSDMQSGFTGTLNSVPASSSADTVDVFILAGQSNMVGQAKTGGLPEHLQRPQTDVLFNYRDRWEFLQPGSGNDFGPEITFGRTSADRWPDRQIALVKYAVGGTNLAIQWKAETGPLYKILLSKVRAAMRLLEDSGKEPRLAGFIWMQGESDAGREDFARAYRENLIRFIDAIRRDLGDQVVPNLPFVIGEINAPGQRYRDIVRQAQRDVARSVLNTSLVVTDDLPLRDGIHYNAEGQIRLGERFATSASALMSVRRFKAKCGSGGTIKMKVRFADRWHDGQEVVFNIGDDPTPLVTTIRGRKARLTMCCFYGTSRVWLRVPFARPPVDIQCP